DRVDGWIGLVKLSRAIQADRISPDGSYTCGDHKPLRVVHHERFSHLVPDQSGPVVRDDGQGPHLPDPVRRHRAFTCLAGHLDRGGTAAAASDGRLALALDPGPGVPRVGARPDGLLA